MKIVFFDENKNELFSLNVTKEYSVRITEGAEKVDVKLRHTNVNDDILLFDSLDLKNTKIISYGKKNIKVKECVFTDFYTKYIDEKPVEDLTVTFTYDKGE